MGGVGECGNDPVDKPTHYTQGSIEVIDFIEDQDFVYHAGNVIKYVSRYRYKNGLEDLKKAQWYLDRLIKITERCKPDYVYESIKRHPCNSMHCLHECSDCRWSEDGMNGGYPWCVDCCGLDGPCQWEQKE